MMNFRPHCWIRLTVRKTVWNASSVGVNMVENPGAEGKTYHQGLPEDLTGI